MRQSTNPITEKQLTVDTEATGRIKLIANSQQNALDYQLSLSNLHDMVNGAKSQCKLINIIFYQNRIIFGKLFVDTITIVRSNIVR